MKQTILSFIFVLFFLFNGSLKAQELIVSENESFRIEKVYPNPIDSYVFVQVFSENYGTIQFELIDILGNKIKLWNKMELVPGSQKIKLDFQAFHSGFYLLKGKVDGQFIVKRLRKL